MRARLHLLHRICAAAALGVVLAGCRSGGVPAAPAAAAAPVADPCALGVTTVRPPRTLTVLMTEPEVPGRPADPATRTDRFVLRHIYEPLVRVSCEGRLIPALAESWRTVDEGRTWLVTLRNEARFWDGTPVQSAHVLAAWAGHRVTEVTVPWAGIERAVVVDERQFLLTFSRAVPDLPTDLADPRLSVTLRSRGTWPLGSGPYRPTYHDSTLVIIETWDSGIPGARDLSRVVEVHTGTGAVARDHVDQGIHYILTEDRSLLEYAASKGYVVKPAAWDLAYRLFVPATRTSDPPTEGPGAGFLEAVARDAVEGEARVAEAAGGWQQEACGLGPGSSPDLRQQPRRVVYPSGDETARALAHRLVTFAGAPGQGGDWLGLAFRNPPGARSFPFAVGLEPAAWADAAQRGDEVAYVFAVPRRPLARCTPPPRTDGTWMTLVETRAGLAVQAGFGGLTVDWDGTARLSGIP